MNSLNFNVDTTPEKYFHQLVEILRVISPFNQLRRRQREVFAEILYQFYLYRKEDEEERERIVFDRKTKEEIASRLGISIGNLYNIYKELRKVKLLTRDGINKQFRFEYLKYKNVTYKLRERNNNREAV
jgi:CRP-like cAMP-binding protein